MNRRDMLALSVGSVVASVVGAAETKRGTDLVSNHGLAFEGAFPPPMPVAFDDPAGELWMQLYAVHDAYATRIVPLALEARELKKEVEACGGTWIHNAVKLPAMPGSDLATRIYDNVQAQCEAFRWYERRLQEHGVRAEGVWITQADASPNGCFGGIVYAGSASMPHPNGISAG